MSARALATAGGLAATHDCVVVLCKNIEGVADVVGVGIEGVKSRWKEEMEVKRQGEDVSYSPQECAANSLRKTKKSMARSKLVNKRKKESGKTFGRALTSARK